MDKFKLVQTCGGCPEQYDVYYQDDKVGYMRLRHGSFRAEYRGDTVYTAQPRGDGVFHPEERTKYLNAACKAIWEAMQNLVEEEEELFEITYPTEDEE